MQIVLMKNIRYLQLHEMAGDHNNIITLPAVIHAISQSSNTLLDCEQAVPVCIILDLVACWVQYLVTLVLVLLGLLQLNRLHHSQISSQVGTKHHTQCFMKFLMLTSYALFAFLPVHASQEAADW